jgi:hypothetical protein
MQRLKALYAEGLAGNEHEFAAYRVLYALVTGGDVQREIRGLKPSVRDHHHVKHAMRVRMRRVLSAIVPPNQSRPYCTEYCRLYVGVPRGLVAQLQDVLCDPRELTMHGTVSAGPTGRAHAKVRHQRHPPGLSATKPPFAVCGRAAGVRG